VVTAKDGRIVDAQFRAGAANCLEIAKREQPDLIVLQSRSPSCGVKQRYDGTFTGTLVNEAGVTAQLLMENGFRCIDVEDLVEVHDDVLIRKLSSEEIGLLKDFLYEAIFIPEGVEPPPRDIVERPELRIYYECFGTDAADHCLVAEADGRVVGAVWTRIMDDYGHVDDETPSFAISLIPECRGKGIGTRLMRDMLNLLKEQGFKRASLAVQKANYAVRMYKNVGFEIIDENDE
jgi:ribosomal protein S18 acetylase RimI-like enzyme